MYQLGVTHDEICHFLAGGYAQPQGMGPLFPVRRSNFDPRQGAPQGRGRRHKDVTAAAFLMPKMMLNHWRIVTLLLKNDG